MAFWQRVLLWGMIGRNPLPPLQATKKPRDDAHWSQEHPQKIPDIWNEVGPNESRPFDPLPSIHFSGVLNVVSGRVGWHFAIEQRSCHPGWLGYIGIYTGCNTTQVFNAKLILYVQTLEIYRPVWHDALFGPLESPLWLRLVRGGTTWCPICHCFLAIHNQQKSTKRPQIHTNIHVMNT